MFYTSFAEDAGATNDYISILRPAAGETVLDVGAYCGLSVIAFARAVGPTGKIYAFEPDPANFAALTKNIDEAKLANVVLKNAALSSTEGTLLFSSEGNMGSAIVGEARLRGAAIEIRSERLKSLYESGEIARIDVVKADIEGAEYALLEDSVDVIRKTRARWAIELLADPVSKVGVDVDRVRSIFDHVGYVSYLQPASESAAAPTLFTFPDDRVPASRELMSAGKTNVQLLSEAQASLAQHAAALSALQQSYRELVQAQERRPDSIRHRVRSLFSGR